MAEAAAAAGALAGGPVQIAYAVTDLEEAALEWSRRFGAGPFFVRHHIPASEVFLDGVPGEFDHSSAYGWWGSVMVELVEIHGPALMIPDIGLHHQAYFVDSFEAASQELTASGWRPALIATSAGTRFAFHDAGADLGHLVEIYEGTDRLRGFYTMVAAAADGWDGSDPVRPLDRPSSD